MNLSLLPPLAQSETIVYAVIALVVLLILVIGILALISRFYKKVGPDEAIVRTGWGGMQVVTANGIFVMPVVHHSEKMDLTLKSFEIAREGAEGLICKDNIRADIRVAFFIRIDKTQEEMCEVAQSIGCKRASQLETLRELFDSKFSEALKTVGKQFEFVELYDKREQFKGEILKVIGTDLNGYRLDDAAIDYLEQTRLELLNPNNILDAEGIKKITELTATEKVQENHFTREREKTLKKQDVEAQEAILELERQRVEATEKQKREIAEITAKEEASAKKVQEENRLQSERARIATDEELGVAEENKLRQILVAQRNKERTDAVELERVNRDRELESTERLRLVGVAEVEKEKAIETERRNIQEVIRERVAVERAVVEEQERIKDTEEFAAADRKKKVEVTAAEMAAEQAMVREVKAAESKRNSAQLLAEQVRIEAEASRDQAEKRSAATKMLAEAATADHSSKGLADALVLEASAAATEKQGMAEARVMKEKYTSEAQGISEKAAAMKELDGVGKEHEEFKLRLEKDKQIEIAAIDAQKSIAGEQALVLGEALKSAKIDIVGGDGEFFDQISSAVKGGKSIDRFILNSQVATDIKNTFFKGDPEHFKQNLAGLVSQFNLSSGEIKDLSVAALVAQLLSAGASDSMRSQLVNLLGMAGSLNLADKTVGSLVVSGSAKSTTKTKS
ncbi:flotillin family protein [Aureliella helgolandensis]|uniref:Inner membrane protein YqiK n=1 Tax=Aureliella helgolandensis TaxID=2527968 RepID=A0A518G921_9BACT|nr:flotillin family protein [Aureliella helgolandensis]QDV25081.1 Inner membrane protein YqiK [Aureliella helgolandensis]